MIHSRHGAQLHGQDPHKIQLVDEEHRQGFLDRLLLSFKPLLQGVLLNLQIILTFYYQQ